MPNTKLAVLSHASNVAGTVNPIAQIGAVMREAGVLFLVDAAQSAGILPIDVQADHIDLLAFPGHKSLLGPMGTGGLYVGERVDLRCFREGGTGTASEAPEQPRQMPYRLEAGTMNVHGLSGLAAGIKFILQNGVEAIREHERALMDRLWQGLSEIPGLTLYGPADSAARTSIVSFNLAGWEPTDVGAILDSSFDIAVRPGLHCAPLAHRTLGAFPAGSVRMSCGFFHTVDDMEAAVEAVKQIAATAG
jgi:selenocysteine lyase/cysteine desulfurase